MPVSQGSFIFETFGNIGISEGEKKIHTFGKFMAGFLEPFFRSLGDQKKT